MSLKKHVLITGASSGIGLDAALGMSKQGYIIFATVRKDEDKQRLESLLAEGSKVFICDITSKEAVEKTMSSIKNILGTKKLFALINNAGIVVPGPMSMVSDEDFEKQMNVNLVFTRHFTNKVIPLLDQKMQEIKSKIIFISSISGIFAAPFNGPYCVSKHALECLIDIYRRELHYVNIDVVAIQPGPIKTKIWGKSQGQFEQYKGGAYDLIIKKADKIITNTEKSALDVKLVTDLILKILKSKKTKNRYMIHKNAFLFKLISYCLPSGWLDKMIWKNLGNADPQKYRPV